MMGGVVSNGLGLVSGLKIRKVGLFYGRLGLIRAKFAEGFHAEIAEGFHAEVAEGGHAEIAEGDHAKVAEGFHAKKGLKILSSQVCQT